MEIRSPQIEVHKQGIRKTLPAILRESKPQSTSCSVLSDGVCGNPVLLKLFSSEKGKKIRMK